MNFTQDADEFVSYLGRAGRDIKHARDNFLALIDHWKLLSEKRFGGLASVELLPDQKGFSGTVLGKAFTIQITPISENSIGMIEGIVAVQALDGSQSEIGRFRFNRDGNLVTNDSPEAGSSYDQMVSIKIFMGVLRSVLEARTPLAT